MATAEKGAGVLRQLSAEELSQALRTAMITGPIRALDLVKRTPALFAERGWPPDGDAISVAAAAVSCVKIGARGQRFRLPLHIQALGAPGRELMKLADSHPVPALAIVETLDLHRLLEP